MKLVDALIKFEINPEMETSVRKETLRQQRTALRHILAGETRDSISSVRLLALFSLTDQLDRAEVYRTFEIAANEDPAKTVRDAAMRAISALIDERSIKREEEEPEDA